MPRSTTDIIRHAEELADLVESDDVTLDRASPEVTRVYKELLAAVINAARPKKKSPAPSPNYAAPVPRGT